MVWRFEQFSSPENRISPACICPAEDATPQPGPAEAEGLGQGIADPHKHRGATRGIPPAGRGAPEARRAGFRGRKT